MSTNVGSLVYCTDQGLGILARDYYTHGIVTHPIIVTRDSLRSHPQHFDWYPADTPRNDINYIDNNKVIQYWLDHRVKLALFFETPFSWPLIQLCRTKGIKTAVVVMHECTPRRINPYEYPDHWLCPSALDEQSIKANHSFHSIRRVTVPVDTTKVIWKERTHACIFVHNAGHGGLKGRNGTAEVLSALPLIQSPARFIIRSQHRLDIRFDEVDSGGNDGQRWGGSGRVGNTYVTYWGGNAPYESLYNEGDVFLFPTAFDALSLPIQEACAAGMLVMTGNRFPMNTWLPLDPLIPVEGYRKERVGGGYLEYDRALYDPRKIAETIDAWYGKDITQYSSIGRQWGETNSWHNLQPVYKELINALCS